MIANCILSTQIGKRKTNFNFLVTSKTGCCKLYKKLKMLHIYSKLLFGSIQLADFFKYQKIAGYKYQLNTKLQYKTGIVCFFTLSHNNALNFDIVCRNTVHYNNIRLLM